VQSSIEKRQARLKDPSNYKQFYVSNTMNLYGFATQEQIELAKATELRTLKHKNRMLLKNEDTMVSP